MHIHLFLGEWICHQIRPWLALVNSSVTISKIHEVEKKVFAGMPCMIPMMNEEFGF
jgi:hypothetical protein